MPKLLSILGSTGSIGTSTLDVVRSHSSEFKIVALSCGKNLKLFTQQIAEFKPELVSVREESDAALLRDQLGKNSPQIVFGAKGAVEVATHPKAQMVVAAIVGAAGLLPTLKALEAGKQVGLANKEAMVIAGPLMNAAARKSNAQILPIDSEHNAIFQALQGHDAGDIRRVILTASGGPFLRKTCEELERVTLEEALKHPNWNMGPKITIDSATLMNKGLEVIEARWLFDLEPDKIAIIVHPQSIVHSMVEYHDGSVIAQLGIPDMRIPIAYALGYPKRLDNQLPSLALTQVRALEFYEPDYEKFACLKLAREALRKGADAPCVLNAANEIVVDAFLNGRIGFLQIPQIISAVLNRHRVSEPKSIDDLLKVDQWAREEGLEQIENLNEVPPLKVRGG